MYLSSRPGSIWVPLAAGQLGFTGEAAHHPDKSPPWAIASSRVTSWTAMQPRFPEFTSLYKNRPIEAPENGCRVTPA